MNLGDFKDKNSLSNKQFSNKADQFIKQLSDFFSKNEKNNKEILNINNDEDNNLYKENNKIEENKIYVVSDINDNLINVVDIENGNEIKIYISIDENCEKNKYVMDKFEFFNLNLTDNIVMRENKLYITNEKVEIKNDIALELLSDLYMEEEESEGQKYEVVEIKENKIYLTNSDGSGGYFSIYKELYPDFIVGDIVQKNNKKYHLLSHGRNHNHEWHSYP